MIIDIIDQVVRELDKIDAKIKHLENSPNRAFILIESETLTLFHFFNLCFKHFWKEEFDRKSASQLLLYQKFVRTHSELSARYTSLLREQVEYLKSILAHDEKSFKDLAPVFFGEEKSKDIIDYYENQLKYETDTEGKPLYKIHVDNNIYFEDDGEGVNAFDFYTFRSDRINYSHYKGLLGIYYSLKSIFNLMSVVCSYPEELISGYKPSQEEIINALENEMRHYAKDIGKNVERELKKAAQYQKPSRHAQLTPDVWGLVMDEEDDLYRLAISGQLENHNEKRFENIIEEHRRQLVDNSSLLQKIMSTAIDGELFDIRLSVETHNLLSSLNADNLDLFYELVLRRNIIQRNMFPEKLDDEYKKWLNSSEEQQPGDDPTPEEKIKRSLERLMQERIKVKKNRKEFEEPLFYLQNHWQGVYRILVDKKQCQDADFEGFDSYINNLMPDVVNKPYTIESVKQISKTDYNIPFEKWKYDGETSGKRKVYERMYEVTKRFKEILEEEGL